MALAHHLAFLWLSPIFVIYADHFSAVRTFGPMLVKSEDFGPTLLANVAIEEAKIVE